MISSTITNARTARVSALAAADNARIHARTVVGQIVPRPVKIPVPHPAGTNVKVDVAVPVEETVKAHAVVLVEEVALINARHVRGVPPVVERIVKQDAQRLVTHPVLDVALTIAHMIAAMINVTEPAFILELLYFVPTAQGKAQMRLMDASMIVRIPVRNPAAKADVGPAVRVVQEGAKAHVNLAVGLAMQVAQGFALETTAQHRALHHAKVAAEIHVMRLAQIIAILPVEQTVLEPVGKILVPALVPNRDAARYVQMCVLTAAEQDVTIWRVSERCCLRTL